MTDSEQHEATMEDIRKLTQCWIDQHEHEARRILKPWWFASKFARDMAIIDLTYALRSKS